MDNFRQPHDRLFRRVFGEPTEAAELLRTALPPGVLAAINWPTLRCIGRSFLDDELREHVTDVLFTADLHGRPALLYVLFEHKSTDERLTAFQLLRYSVRILEQHLRDHPKHRRLPPLLPIVFYHGKRPWQQPRRVRDLVDFTHVAPELSAWLTPLQPDLQFVLHDLSTTANDTETRALSIVASLSIRVLLAARGSTLAAAERMLRSWRKVLPQLLAHRRGNDVLIALYSYLLQTAQCERPQLDAVVRRLFDAQTSSTMTTVADQLRAEGHVEGRVEGRVDTLRELTLRALKQRFGPLPEDIEARMQAASPADLEATFERALSAKTLREALDA